MMISRPAAALKADSLQRRRRRRHAAMGDGGARGGAREAGLKTTTASRTMAANNTWSLLVINPAKQGTLASSICIARMYHGSMTDNIWIAFI